MRHEDAVLLLPEFHRGDLDDADRAEVQAHLESCPECAALDRTYQSIHAAMKADLQGAWHPPVEDVVRYVVHRDRLNPDAAQRFFTHVERCETCREEVLRTRRAHESAGGAQDLAGKKPPRDGVVRSGTARYLAVAAATVLIALIYPAYLGVFRVPILRERAESLTAASSTMESEIRRLEQSLENAQSGTGNEIGWSGALSLNLLSSTLRGGGPTQIKWSADEPFVALGIEIDLPEMIAAGEAILFRITGEHGVVAAEVRLPAAEVRRAIRSAGVVMVLVPSENLSAGDYTLEVSRPDKPGARKLLLVEFHAAGADTP